MFHSTSCDTPLEDRRELAALFLRQTWSAIVAQLVMGVITSYLVWTELGSPFALIWFAALALTSAIRLGMIRLHRPLVAGIDRPGLARMENAHCAMAGVSGLCWGAVPWVAFFGTEITVDYLTAAMVFGMAGSATATLAAIPRAFPSFVWPAALPFVAKAALLGGNLYYTAAATIVFGIFALTYFSRNIHHTLAESIRLRRENSELVASLREEKAAAEEAYRIKSLFLAGVSHDLRHPIHALGLYLGYLKAQQNAPETAAGLARSLPGMEQALGGMDGLLSRLLELSRLEAGEYRLKEEWVEMQSLFDRCDAQFRQDAQARGLRLRFVATGAGLRGDPVLLHSILSNLVGNAVRYTRKGGVVVGLRHRGAALAIQVVDSGPGIPADHLPLLFDAYRRFDDTRRANELGFGLGLALVKKQCDLAGYQLEVASRVGQGSRFSVALFNRNPD